MAQSSRADATPPHAVPTVPAVTVRCDAEPVLSICVVLYRGGALAVDALRALSEHTTEPYEVIVVDNASPDGSGPLVAGSVTGVRYVANPRNRGFGGAMNQATMMARAPYVVALNPDAFVTPGWAGPLLRRAAHDRVGAVAPLLVDRGADRPQEAGSYADGSGFTFAVGADDSGPLGPDARFARVVDYASAACLLLRRDAVAQVGGFDPRFDPAYFEDIDLAFSLAAAGWRTWVEPSSAVEHARGGTDHAGTASALVSRNHPRFLNKWRAEITSRPAHAEGARAQLSLRDWRADVRVLVDASAPGSPAEAALGAAHRWRGAAPDGLVTVLCDAARPPEAGDIEWLRVDAAAAQHVRTARAGHYDIEVDLAPAGNDVDAAAAVAAARARPHTDRHRWDGGTESGAASVTSVATATPGAASPLSEAERVALLEQLAREHQLLRAQAGSIGRFAEDAVARAVIAEKHVVNLQADLAASRAHVDALLGSRTMRMLAPLRRVYGALRNVGGTR